MKHMYGVRACVCARVCMHACVLNKSDLFDIWSLDVRRLSETLNVVLLINGCGSLRKTAVLQKGVKFGKFII